MLKLFAAILSVTVFSVIFFGGEAHANVGPSNIFPDPNDVCHLPTTGGCATPRPVYMSVGFGEHISGYTTNEVYVYSSGTVTLRLLEGKHCQTYSTAFHAHQSLDFGTAVTTYYTLIDKQTGAVLQTWTVPPCNQTNYADYSNRNVDISRYLTGAPGGRAYYLRAFSPATTSSENSYRVQVVGGNANLGSGVSAYGGVSLTMRDMPFQQEFTYAFHFAVSCDPIAGERRIRAYDADRGIYQGVSGYREINWAVLTRPRGSGAAWTTVTSGIATGGNAAYETWLTAVQPGQEYRVALSGVERPNAIEILLPNTAAQNEIGDDCVQPWNYTPRIYREGGGSSVNAGGLVGMLARATNTSTANGESDVDLLLVPTAATRPYVSIYQTGGSSPSTYSTGTIAWWNRPAISAGSYWQPSTYSRYRVSPTTPHNTSLCFYTRVRPDSYTNANYQNSGQICWTVQNLFNYEPSITREGGSSVAYPGRTIGMLAGVRNASTFNAYQNYDLQLIPTSATQPYVAVNRTGGSGGAQSGDVISWLNRPRLNAGASWSPLQTTRYDVALGTPNGQPLCFYTRVRPDSAANSGWDNSGVICWTTDRREYIYEPRNVSTFPQSGGLYYAGEGFGASARVDNVGNTSGPSYRQEIEFLPSGIGGDPYAVMRGGLSAGAGSTVTTASTTFSIPASSAHGSSVTCRNRVEPHRGLGPPSPTTVILGGRNSPGGFVECFTVENRRFNVVFESGDISLPTSVLPGETFDVTAYVCNDGSVGAATGSYSQNTQTAFSPGNALATGGQSFTDDIVRGGGSSQCSTGYTTQFTVAPTALLGDNVCINVAVDRLTGFTFPDPNGYNVSGSVNHTVCTDVAEQAFFTVENGSVWAGGNFDPSDSGYQTDGTGFCSPADPGDGTITTARYDDGTATVGAWADYIAGAVNAISNFGSAHAAFGSPVDGNEWTFANAGGDGNFGAGRCITDLSTYLSDDFAGNPFVSLHTSPNALPTVRGQYVRQGDMNLTDAASMTLPAGRNVTLIVDGNVTISENIEYNYSGLTNANQIPSLILVVRGDIFIRPNVTQLDGIFFAKPDSAGNGVIDTCRHTTPTPTSADKLSDAICSDRLLINGVFAAQDVEFRRTFGGVTGANPNGGRNPAEVFRFNSEVYLANHVLISDFTPDVVIDQLLELPPVVN